jgi:YihY family inner membrane protein
VAAIVSNHTLQHLLGQYGYAAVFAFVMVESLGIPVPGETMVIAAAVYAGTTGHMTLALVWAAAAGGAIIGDNIGFGLGHWGGYRLLRRHGRKVRLDEARLKVGRLVFDRHGGKVVFFGRFVSVLRTYAAFLAGTNRMPYGRFLAFNAAGGIVWAGVFASAFYFLGRALEGVRGPVDIAIGVVAAAIVIASVVVIRRRADRLQEEAERAYPGPLDARSARDGAVRRSGPPPGNDGLPDATAENRPGDGGHRKRPPPMSSIKEKADQAQRRRGVTSVAVATIKKYQEDRSSNLASEIAFWAFFSIFPLFLVFVTILGYVLPTGTKNDVLETVSQLFPLVKVNAITGLSGSWWPLVVGGLSALWSGTGVVRTVQYAFNSIWEIPEKDRPGLVEKTLRSVAALGLIGVGLLVATLISGLATGRQTTLDVTWYYRVAGYIVSLLLDVGLFVIAFRLLTSREVTTREVLPGALLSGVAFFVLQQLSSLIISRYLHSAQSTYGHFAVVITMLWWFYLQSQITLLGAQLNVVLAERLHPRSFFGGPETDADRRALAAYAEERTYHEEEEVDTRVRRGGVDGS